MPVLISRRGVPPSPIGTASLRRRAERMLAALALQRAELSILLCDDSTIHTLNRAHRRKNKPTDVLAFALREGEPIPGAEGQLGDIVISLDTAQRQAREHDRTLWQEVSLLLAHGILHLIGYDHHTAAEERRMNARADMLIAACATRPPHAQRQTVDKRPGSVDKQPRRGPRRAPVRSSKR